jgi:hypothetical protein
MLMTQIDSCGYVDSATWPPAHKGSAPSMAVRFGSAILALFVTEATPNNFPTLPVRENENVFAWFAGFPDATTELRRGSDGSSLQLAGADLPGLTRPPQTLRLTPTARSLLTGSSPDCAAVSSADFKT